MLHTASAAKLSELIDIMTLHKDGSPKDPNETLELMRRIAKIREELIGTVGDNATERDELHRDDASKCYQRLGRILLERHLDRLRQLGLDARRLADDGGVAVRVAAGRAARVDPDGGVAVGRVVREAAARVRTPTAGAGTCHGDAINRNETSVGEEVAGAGASATPLI